MASGYHNISPTQVLTKMFDGPKHVLEQIDDNGPGTADNFVLQRLRDNMRRMEHQSAMLMFEQGHLLHLFDSVTDNPREWYVRVYRQFLASPPIGCDPDMIPRVKHALEDVCKNESITTAQQLWEKFNPLLNAFGVPDPERYAPGRRNDKGKFVIDKSQFTVVSFLRAVNGKVDKTRINKVRVFFKACRRYPALLCLPTSQAGSFGTLLEALDKLEPTERAKWAITDYNLFKKIFCWGDLRQYEDDRILAMFAKQGGRHPQVTNDTLMLSGADGTPKAKTKKKATKTSRRAIEAADSAMDEDADAAAPAPAN